mmetsp:Transcript_15714/g.24428  ORF Transcript_15714/g.24428 Transcript_15714/m.24428 type:complete len:319 (-) Transcript_15714:88-1044(-)
MEAAGRRPADCAEREQGSSSEGHVLMGVGRRRGATARGLPLGRLTLLLAAWLPVAHAWAFGAARADLTGSWGLGRMAVSSALHRRPLGMPMTRGLLGLTARRQLLEDPYNVLGLPATAPADQIRAAFRRLSKQHHPDAQISKGGESIKAQEQFYRINEAYHMLIDPQLRAKYDARNGAAFRIEEWFSSQEQDSSVGQARKKRNFSVSEVISVYTGREISCDTCGDSEGKGFQTCFFASLEGCNAARTAVVAQAMGCKAFKGVASSGGSSKKGSGRKCSVVPESFCGHSSVHCQMFGEHIQRDSCQAMLEMQNSLYLTC